MESAINGFEGGGETVNSVGVPMLMSVRDIPNTDWIVAVQLPLEEAYGPIAKARTRILYTSGIALFLVTAIGAVGIRRVSHPLQQLEQVAVRITADLETIEAISPIADSSMDQLTNIRSGDEIGRLASSFLNLTAKLRSTLYSLNSTNQKLLEAKEATEAEFNQRQFQHSLVRAIHEVSPDGILVVNDEGAVVSHNKKYLDIWKVSFTSGPNDLSDYPDGIPDQLLRQAVLDRVKAPEPFLQRIRELTNRSKAAGRF